MNNPFLLSIIIPCYNVEKYIEECFNSLNKNIPEHLIGKIELIIINDNSSDKTGYIISKYNWGNWMPYITIINNNNNVGPSITRNDGLDIAKGKYIAFIDSDDIWLEDISLILNNLNNNEHDIIEFNAVRFNTLKDIQSNPLIFHYIKENSEHLQSEALTQYKSVVFSAGIWMVWGRFFKRSFIGCERFPIGKTYEDIIFTATLYNRASSILTYSNKCVGYRFNSSSITAIPKKNDIDSLEWTLNTSRNLFKQDNNSNTFTLYLNVFLFYSTMLDNFVMEKNELIQPIRQEILSSTYFSQLTLFKKFRVIFPKTYFFIRKIYNYLRG